jgi:hypothetical protein
MHTINDFVIGTNVIHKINGNGIVVAIDFNQGMIKVLFDNGETGYYYTVATYLDLLSDLTIIEQPKTTEEKTMQEFEPITKDNIEEVLKYNKWTLEIYPKTPKYDNHKKYSNKKYPVFIYIYESYFEYVAVGAGSRLSTQHFDEFLAFVQKRIELNPIPKKPEFDFDNYMSINAKNINYIPNQFDNTFNLYFDAVDYAQTKENADILIAAAKLLEGLK